MSGAGRPFAARVAASLTGEGGVAEGARLVVAASGGVDSTVLLRTLVGAGWSVIAIHVDHSLRDGEREAQFVRDLGESLGIETETVRVEVAPGNVQARAREARYAALADAARRHGAAAVVTGHTATDQAETVLLNLVRGSGLRGLAGMAVRRDLGGVALVRPLLWATRAEVEAEAAARGWGWIEDPTNATGRYRRNRLRRDVLPLLEAEGGSRTAARIAAAAAAARAALDRPALLDLVGTADGRGGVVDLDRVRVLDRPARLAVWADALRRWAPGAAASAALLDRIDALLDAPVGQRVGAAGAVVWRERGALAFTTPTAPPPPVVVEASGRWSAAVGAGWVEGRPLGAVPPSFPSSPNAEVVDADRVPGRLVVRPWRDGDRVRPLGRGGSALVSDLLADRRVRPSRRRDVLVVEGGGEVLWVVGHRLARAVAVTDATRRAARWTVSTGF
ncbi:tRNA lysidine(34) synthetase TilS [Rubrivirga sp. S365]|uniref:tRNA(Ile)-lysidine synthase n=1 Tax=Rubrivirga litoralis TaxID=3075598 RepID=A0ABU3BME1_9BACT|nr:MULTISPECIES: tRNA lysidine(34) synthetase TilS [unclassified Rubrivirga]MDT0630464.1 tRNA lysidine(34) synthetase TilS [Rubrivirga sp. F394]MDT7857558.1 tRNA lysidine(34) synthetase TilS [Rubrivirga sp. S365]